MASAHRRVLVVDDDQDWLESLTDFLVEEGYAVTTAPNGLAALDALSRIQPLVIVTDLEMPLMGGRKLLATVHGRDPGMPVVVVTGQRIQGDDVSLAGASRIIRKPVPVEDLLSAIAEAATRRVEHLRLKNDRHGAAVVPGSRVNRVSSTRETVFRLASKMCSSISATQVVILAMVIGTSVALLGGWRLKFLG